MSNATFTFGRFNPPTESGHGKLVQAVQDHAESTGGHHYIFATHSQDKKKNPLTYTEKTGAMKKLFPTANVVDSGNHKTIIDVMKHLEKKGHSHLTMVAGSDRVDGFHKLLNNYNGKEYKFKKINVVSAGHRDPDSEGSEGMSASKLRGLVTAGKKDEFVSHYSDKKLGADIHDKVKKGMQMESVNPVGIFLIGGPGSGKDYVLNNIFSRFDLTEIQVEHLLSGSAKELVENNENIVINGALDSDKISAVEAILEGYTIDYVYVSVTNKVSRDRNAMRANPLVENKRLEKWYRADKLAKAFENAFVFNNSINLNESGEMEKVFFAAQIEKLLERLIENGLTLREKAEPKAFTQIREKTKEATGNLKNACWSGYTAVGMKMKNGRKVPNCVPVKEQMDTKTQAARYTGVNTSNKLARQGRVRDRHVASHNAEMHKIANEGIMDIFRGKKETQIEKFRRLKGLDPKKNPTPKPGYEGLDFGDEKRSNEYYANKQMAGMKEDVDINQLFERQLVGTDEYRQHAISMTPGQTQEIQDAYKTMETANGAEECSCGGECNGDCGCGGNCDGNCNGGIREGSEPSVRRRFSSFRASLKEATKESGIKEDADEVDLTPTLKKRKNPKTVTPGKAVRTHIDGLPVTTARLYGEQVSLEEAVQYHLDNKVSFTENVFRPGSDMFFQMIGEAKRLFAEGVYTPADGYEKDLLESDIGETGIYEGEEVLLDFPFIEELNEDIKDQYNELMKMSIKDLRARIQRSSKVVDVSGFKSKDQAASHILRQQHGHKKVAAAFGLNEEDETGGKGIGKPFRSGGGGAVYVKNAKGNVIKVNFSQSGMKKRINEPGRVRSFVARHHCLTNKDKTSASYWACRWPRYFSNTGQQWW